MGEVFCYNISINLLFKVFAMKKIFSIFLALILICTLFSSCKKEETDMQVYYPVTEDFVSIDPQIASDASSKMIAYNCFEGLVRVDAEGKIVPAGADSWTVSPDDLVYTFSLRRDAKWYLTNTSKEEMSDTDAEKSRIPADFDERVTAKDYVFGLKRAVDPATNAADGKYLASIANAAEILAGKKQVSELGVEAVDDYTLKITLSQPDPNLLYYLTRLAAMPCNEQFFNACRGRYGLAMEYMLCNGAYIVYRWSEGAVIRLEKNPLYSGADKALNDRVWVYYVEDASSVAGKIEAGNYDAGYVAANEVSMFSEKKGFSLTARNDVLWGYWFNGNTTDFSVTDLRVAFASAVDKEFLTPPDYIAGKTDRILLSSLAPYFDYTPHPIAYDEKKAAEYFTSATVKNENILENLTVTVLTTEDFAEGVTKQIQLWQRVFGIDVKIDVQPRDKAVSRLYAGNYQIAFLPMTVTATNTAEYFRTFMSLSDYNVSGYRNSNYDELINSLSGKMSDEQKIDVFKSCEQSLISHGVVIPAFTEASYFVTGKGVSGIYSFSESEVYFRNCILE